MKVKSILFFFILVICSSFQTSQKKLETGWYFVTENKQNTITFEDLDSHEKFTVERLPIIIVSDLKKVKLTDENMSGLRFKKLNLKLNAQGFKKWDLATDEMSKKNKSAIFVFENVVYCHLRVSHKKNYISPSIVDNDLNSSKLKDIYESMPENIKK